MSAFEIFLIILLSVAAVWGFAQGIVKQVGALAGIVLGIVACRLWGDKVVALFMQYASADSNSTIIIILSYVVLFLVVYLAVVLIFRLIRHLIGFMCLGLVDRLAGAAFKALLWLFILSLGLNLFGAWMPEKMPTGPWAERVTSFAPAIFGSESINELIWQIESNAPHQE